jgi:hypothetical protein
MKSASNSIMHSAAAGASRPAKKGGRSSRVRALLDALHESRRRQANKIIHDHSHLLAKPQQIAELVNQPARNSAMSIEKYLESRFRFPAMTKEFVVIAAVLLVFLVHIIAAAVIVDGRASTSVAAAPVSSGD